jgi:endonuclease YncB( thermonuclease family)
LRFYLALWIACFSPLIAAAADIEGRVVGIADGDTLTVLRQREQTKVRLAEIDAPEKAQPFGERSRQSLAELCFQQPVRVEDKGRDRYGRTIGRVLCAGIDANAEQVRRGMAWVYDRYVTDQALYTLQTQARSAHSGLWADASPVPPWEWRHGAR